MKILLYFAACLPTAVAAGQGFNVDLGDPGSPAGAPLATYGAGAGQPGHWNAVGSPYIAVLTDVDGSPSFVKIVPNGAQPADDHAGNAGTSGGDEALMDDGARLTGSFTYAIHSLAPGAYAVYTYAWSPDLPQATSVSVAGASTGPAILGAGWPGQHVEGITYSRHLVTTFEEILLTATPIGPEGFLNGFQTERLGERFETFCEGASAPCPCGNVGQPGAGCENAQGSGGVELDVLDWRPNGTGGGQIVFRGSSYPGGSQPTAVMIRSPQQAGPPIVFGDGLRCIGLQNLVRFGASTAIGGTSEHTTGHGAGAGAFHYQIWYRSTPIGFCDPTAAFNLSNGLRVTWP